MLGRDDSRSIGSRDLARRHHHPRQKDGHEGETQDNGIASGADCAARPIGGLAQKGGGSNDVAEVEQSPGNREPHSLLRLGGEREDQGSISGPQEACGDAKDAAGGNDKGINLFLDDMRGQQGGNVEAVAG